MEANFEVISRSSQHDLRLWNPSWTSESKSTQLQINLTRVQAERDSSLQRYEDTKEEFEKFRGSHSRWWTTKDCGRTCQCVEFRRRDWVWARAGQVEAHGGGLERYVMLFLFVSSPFAHSNTDHRYEECSDTKSKLRTRWLLNNRNEFGERTAQIEEPLRPWASTEWVERRRRNSWLIQIGTYSSPAVCRISTPIFHWQRNHSTTRPRKTSSRQNWRTDDARSLVWTSRKRQNTAKNSRSGQSSTSDLSSKRIDENKLKLETHRKNSQPCNITTVSRKMQLVTCMRRNKRRNIIRCRDTSKSNDESSERCDQVRELMNRLPESEDCRRGCTTNRELRGNVRVFARCVRALYYPHSPFLTNTRNTARTRPFLGGEYCGWCTDSRSCWRQANRSCRWEHSFEFDRVWREHVERVREVSELVQSALDGCNVCVFSYG